MDQTLIEILKSVNTVEQLYKRLNKIELNKTRGTYFEYFTKLFLLFVWLDGTFLQYKRNSLYIHFNACINFVSFYAQTHFN
jgi:hypothetical protein